MANADVEKSSSGFERFLFFVTPILFTAILVAVLLFMFNPDWRNSALEFGNKIPVVKSILPNPSIESTEVVRTDDELTVNNAKEKVDELKVTINNQEAALTKATEEAVSNQKKIEELQAQLDLLTKDTNAEAISTEAYKERIVTLANMYAKMTPSKAAPIFENMTLEEAALILGEMTDTVRGKVLEKMTPKRAADVTIKLKDSDTVDNREIAALQARIAELELSSGQGSDQLDTTEINRTFSAMTPVKAASLLLQLATTSQSRVLHILGVLDNASRSSILTAMADEDKKTTAMLVSKLIPITP
ncbi:MAG: FliG C-terminal domain-containing protein [Candidatus Cohnella colombiensis]|uniref:FliG C-terminal domain-containing protein n=1 Tax=Candidatus Cohnella colombiensis TaxID=3121368 RepID=A0AA95EZ56_9BACL|nr:MAG: FliG C-terminal domain-containing protein [Cohnella sp.]